METLIDLVSLRERLNKMIDEMEALRDLNSTEPNDDSLEQKYFSIMSKYGF